MSDGGNQRSFSRVPFRAEATISADGGAQIKAEVRDISLRGLYAAGAGGIPPGTACRIALILGGADSEVRLQMQGRVTRDDGDGLAVEFAALGFDTYFHLRNIIYYNSRDTTKVEEEFKAHLGLQPRE